MLVPIAAFVVVIGAYVAATLLWPLYAVPPVVAGAPLPAVAAPAAAPAWPANGSAATSVQGMPGSLATTADASSIASITKVVTSLMILDELPLAVGESGPSYSFTNADRRAYYAYLADDQSALDVPVGGSLTEYQMLQGILIGSANNYADRLSTTLWPSDDVFSAAASAWLSQHGVPGITVVEPTGIERENVADPAALLTLAQKALANPVIAEIVHTVSVELPGAGLVENTNSLLADPTVVGVKTGSLEGSYNLLAAQDVPSGDVTVRIYSAVMGQFSDAERDAATQAILAQTAAEVALRPVLPAGTIAGVVTTLWGERAEILTDADISVVLWNSGEATLDPTFQLGDARTANDEVGSMAMTGPLDKTSTGLHLSADIEPPDAWWRITHPLELWGLAG